MRAVPAAMPDTMPDALTLAIPVLLLAHVPPDMEPLNDVVAPAHTLVAPEMELLDGSGFTVTATVL